MRSSRGFMCWVHMAYASIIKRCVSLSSVDDIRGYLRGYRGLSGTAKIGGAWLVGWADVVCCFAGKGYWIGEYEEGFWYTEQGTLNSNCVYEQSAA